MESLTAEMPRVARYRIHWSRMQNGDKYSATRVEPSGAGCESAPPLIAQGAVAYFHDGLHEVVQYAAFAAENVNFRHHAGNDG